MKKILTIILFLISLHGFSQVKQTYNQYGGLWNRLALKWNGGFQLPRSPVSTKDLNVSTIDTGQIYYLPTDSSLWYHTGFQWLKAGGATYTANLPIRITGTVISADTSVAFVPSLTTNARLQKIIDSLNFTWSVNKVLFTDASTGKMRTGNLNWDESGRELSLAGLNSKLSAGLVQVNEIAAPGAPLTNQGYIYEKSDGKLYFINDASVEYDLTAGGGSDTHIGNADLTFTADRFHDLDDNTLIISNGAFDQYLIDGLNRRYGIGDLAAEGNGRSLIVLDTATVTDAYKMPAMQQATTSNILYYNTATGGITYGGFNITSEENFQHYLDKLSSTYGAFYWVSSGTASAVQGFTTSAVPLGMLGPHELKTGTTTTGLACHYTQAGGTYAAIPLSSSIRYNFRARVQIPVVSDGTETFEYYAGFMDDITGSANIVDGVYFTYTHSVSSGEWVCHTESNNTKTTTASGITMTAGQTYDLKLTVFLGTAYFYIDDVLVVTTATNVPDDDTNRITSIGDCIIKSAGTTSRSVYVDILAYGRKNN